MPVVESQLVENESYYVCETDVVLRETNSGSGAVNHLLLGDWLRYLGPTYTHEWEHKGKKRSETYAYVRCRGDNGWLKLREFGSERSLEVNFVDIGQGDGCHIVTPTDKVLLIDAGLEDNMNRFLSWRYNLRNRNVERAPDFDPDRATKKPWKIDYVIMSHPDEDHYGGFEEVFKNPKLSFAKVYHNGIVERPAEPKVDGVDYKDDLGGYFSADDEVYLYDYVTDAERVERIVKAHPSSQKVLMKTYRALFENSANVKVEQLGVQIDDLANATYMSGFGSSASFSLQLLGPITEQKDFGGEKLTTVRKLGAEGVTKNGHSVILKGHYGKLKLLLGGDLNSQSQNFLLKTYAGTEKSPDEIKRDIKRLKKKKQPLKKSDQEKLEQLEASEVLIKSVGRQVFEVDVAKACHHGSQHILDEFIQSVHSVATVISSGDEESHSHPRPDALGAYGKHGRGQRPLLFSTELARSTREFTSQSKNYLALRGITLQIEAEEDEEKKKALLDKLNKMRDRNVAVYGMITLRALGEKVILAQKLERVKRQDRKWDIYELHFDKAEGHFVYETH